MSCDLCGHSTKTQNGMKLHKKNKDGVIKVDGNTSINEEHKEEFVIQDKATRTVVFLNVNSVGQSPRSVSKVS